MASFTIRSCAVLICLYVFSGCTKDTKAPGIKKDSTSSTTSSLDSVEHFDPIQIADANHRIYFQPAIGTKHRFHILEQTSSTAHIQGVPGQAPERAQSKKTEYYLSTEVKSVNKDSSVVMSVKIDSVNITAAQDTQKIVYSSNNKEDASSKNFNEMNAVIGMPFNVTIDRSGNVKKIDQYNSILSALTKNFPDSLKRNPKFKEAADQEAQQMLYTYVMHIIVPVPMGIVKQDTIWRQHQEGNLPIPPVQIPIIMDAKQTMKGFQKRGDRLVAVIEDSTTTVPKKKVIEEGPVTVTVDELSATARGRMHMEDATGIVVQNSIEQVQKTKVSMSSKQAPGQKQSLEQTAFVNSRTDMIE